MRIFMTGATGYIGTAVVRALGEAGHVVSGLCRPGREHLLDALGAKPVVGDLERPEGWRAAAEGAESLVFIGFDGGPEAHAVNRSALDALLQLAPGRHLLYTSGVWVLGDTGDTPAPEDAELNPLPLVSWRPAVEKRVREAGPTAIIRPGIVYGGPGGIPGRFFETAEKEGAASLVGEGENRWACIHRDDLAQLYRAAIERRATGVFHGVDGAAPKVIELARSASAAAGKDGRVHRTPLAVARTTLGGFADALAADQVVAAPRSRSLGWAPTRVSFMGEAQRSYREWKP